MIGTSGGVLEMQAILILKSFASHVFAARAMGLSRTFCDIFGIMQGGTVIGVKLRQSFSSPLTPEQAKKRFKSEIFLMNACCPQKPVRLELWISLAWGRWQFFEITDGEVREVEHACPP